MEVSLGSAPAAVSYSTGGSLLQYVGQVVVGRDVGVSRVIISIAAFLGSIVTGSVLLFGAIRGGFVSIGRNPLASDSITRELLKVSFYSIVIVVAGVALSYGVLVV